MSALQQTAYAAAATQLDSPAPVAAAAQLPPLSLGSPASAASSSESKASSSALSLINSVLAQLRSSRSARRIPPRVNHLDAQLLDSEVYSLVSSQIRRVFRFLAPSIAQSTRLSIEVDTLLHLLLNRYTIFSRRPTPGGQLQNLAWADARRIVDDDSISQQQKLFDRLEHQHEREDDEKSNLVSSRTAAFSAPLTRAQMYGYGLWSVLLRYVWLKFGHHMLLHDWGHSDEALQTQLEHQQRVQLGLQTDDVSWRQHYSEAWRRFRSYPIRYRVYLLSRYAEHVYRLASFINLCVFLYSGRYVSLLHRVFRISYLPIRASAQRQVSFDYMNQSLAWTSMTEFALFCMPMMRVDLISRLYRSITHSLFGAAEQGQRRPNQNDEHDEFDDESGTASDAHTHTCPLCQQQPCVMPHMTNCKHVYCYYCLGCARLNDANFKCIKCNQTVTQQKPCSPALIEQN